MLRLALLACLCAVALAQNTPQFVSASGWDFTNAVTMERALRTDPALTVKKGSLDVTDGDVAVNSGDLKIAAGSLQATRTSYPVILGKRIDNTVGNQQMRALSALTVRRTSTSTLFANLPGGFGPGISFEVEDSSGKVTEMGTLAMKLNANGNGDFAFKTWNGNANPDTGVDANGGYDRLRVFANGNVHVPNGQFSTDSAGYPVIMGRRVSDVTASDSITKSGLTTRRRTLTRTMGQLPPGFGSDISFEVEDSQGTVKELGVIGMKISPSSRRQSSTDPNGDFVFKTWPRGAVTDVDARDAAGEYDRLRIKANRQVEVPSGGSFTCGGTNIGSDGSVAVPANADLTVGGRSVKTFMNDYNAVSGSADRIKNLEDDLWRLRTAFIVLVVLFGVALLCLLCSLCYFCCGGRPLAEREEGGFPFPDKHSGFRGPPPPVYYEQPSVTRASPPPQIQFVQAKPVTMQVQQLPQQTIQVQHSPLMVVGPSQPTLISQPQPYSDYTDGIQPVPMSAMQGQQYSVSY